MKFKNTLKTIMIIIVTAVITVILTMAVLYAGNGKIFSDGSDIQTIGKALSSDTLSTKLDTIKEKISNEYIGKIDENQMREYSIKGYVAGLNDVYSEYLTKDEMKKMTDETDGNYVGIGISMKMDTDKNQIVVNEVFDNSSAQKGGVKAGDVISKVGDKNITADDFDTLPDIIMGKEGTSVQVTFKRDGKDITVTLKRQKVNIVNVTSQMLPNNVGYIYIKSFEGDVSKQFKEKYDDLKKQGMQSLIIDLRNNGGGLAVEAEEIGGYFVDAGKPLLIEKDKNNKESITYSKGKKEIDMKTVVLVNQYSASASEILSGIFNDEVPNSTLVGTKTYGKGVIQSLYQLSDGSGLKITTAQYVTPNRTEINKIGITPQVVTEKYDFNGKLDLQKDIQLKKALEILKK